MAKQKEKKKKRGNGPVYNLRQSLKGSLTFWNSAPAGKELLKREEVNPLVVLGEIQCYDWKPQRISKRQQDSNLHRSILWPLCLSAGALMDA